MLDQSHVHLVLAADQPIIKFGPLQATVNQAINLGIGIVVVALIWSFRRRKFGEVGAMIAIIAIALALKATNPDTAGTWLANTFLPWKN